MNMGKSMARPGMTSSLCELVTLGLVPSGQRCPQFLPASEPPICAKARVFWTSNTLEAGYLCPSEDLSWFDPEVFTFLISITLLDF